MTDEVNTDFPVITQSQKDYEMDFDHCLRTLRNEGEDALLQAQADGYSNRHLQKMAEAICVLRKLERTGR